jgi:oxygen-independent coproporphyrinogen-3 oxidase
MSARPPSGDTGLYVSVPFCRAKCTYCNFASGVYPASLHEAYVERVIAELRAARRWAEELGAILPESVGSIYLGGGTPSLLAPALVHRLFAAIRGEFSVAAGAEVTVECAPGQLAEETLAAFAACGANRISFGVQSFVDREAAASGRLHSRRQALADIERVRGAGIGRVNVDLIAGLAQQSAESFAESLALLLATGVTHASVYMLEVDDDSRLGRELLRLAGQTPGLEGERDVGQEAGQASRQKGGRGGQATARYGAALVPSEEAIAAMYERACGELTAAGVPQYEISNFAAPGFESMHNLRYWRREPYLGLGLDASTMLRCQDGSVLRAATGDGLEEYLAAESARAEQRLEPEPQLEEAWFLGLRLNEGVSLGGLQAEFGAADLAPGLAVLEDLAGDGLIRLEDGCARLSPQGRLFSNEVFERFLGSGQTAWAAEREGRGR